jgi:hypothetical protein
VNALGMPPGPARLPPMSARQAEVAILRVAAHADAIARRLGIPAEQVRAARRIGRGGYGVVLQIPGLPLGVAGLKVTADNTEAFAVKYLIENGAPRGIVAHHAIWLLPPVPAGMPRGLPREDFWRTMRSWERLLTSPREWRPGRGETQSPTRERDYFQTTYRPLWLIHRELLPTPKRTHRLGRLLYTLSHGSADLDEIEAVGADNLYEALRWLADRGFEYRDLRSQNLGVRPAGDLALRDVGHAFHAEDFDHYEPLT